MAKRLLSQFALDVINEASIASQAKRMKLVSHGFGNYGPPNKAVTHRAKNGKLQRVTGKAKGPSKIKHNSSSVYRKPQADDKKKVVTELKKSTYGSYIKKAVDDKADHDRDGETSRTGRFNKYRGKIGGNTWKYHSAEARKRERGIHNATDQLTKEAIVNETSQDLKTNAYLTRLDRAKEGGGTLGKDWKKHFSKSQKTLDHIKDRHGDAGFDHARSKQMDTLFYKKPSKTTKEAVEKKRDFGVQRKVKDTDLLGILKGHLKNKKNVTVEPNSSGHTVFHEPSGAEFKNRKVR